MTLPHAAYAKQARPLVALATLLWTLSPLVGARVDTANRKPPSGSHATASHPNIRAHRKVRTGKASEEFSTTQETKSPQAQSTPTPTPTPELLKKDNKAEQTNDESVAPIEQPLQYPLNEASPRCFRRAATHA